MAGVFGTLPPALERPPENSPQGRRPTCRKHIARGGRAGPLGLGNNEDEAVGDMLAQHQIFMRRAEVEKTANLKGEALRDYYINYI